MKKALMTFCDDEIKALMTFRDEILNLLPPQSSDGRQEASYRLRAPGFGWMYRFLTDVTAGRIPPKDVLEFFAAAFGEILSGKDPKKALHIVKKQGRKVTSSNEYIEIASMIVEQMWAGRSYQDAIETVAVERRQSERNTKRRYSEWKKVAFFEFYIMSLFRDPDFRKAFEERTERRDGPGIHMELSNPGERTINLINELVKFLERHRVGEVFRETPGGDKKQINLSH